MLKQLPKIITQQTGRLKKPQVYLYTTINRRNYSFSTQKQQQVKSTKDDQDAERLKKLQEIQFRKLAMEDIEIKNIRDKIENTKGEYNPFIAYIKLYSNYFILAIVLGCLCLIIVAFVSVSGVYKDPITKKKKILLISQKFQMSLDPILKDIMLTQLCGTSTPNDNISMSLKRKSQEIQKYINQKTCKHYKITVIPSQQHIINILPTSIVLSKNIFTLPQCELQDLKRFILTMERLFSSRLHIKELAFQNIVIFLIAKLKRNTKIDIKLTSIYSRKYEQRQLDSALNEASLLYGDSIQPLKESVQKILQGLGNKIYKQDSKFSLLNRFQIQKRQERQAK